MMAFAIPVDGQLSTFDIPEDYDPNLLRILIDGWIEVVTLPKHCGEKMSYLICDEEGLPKHLPVNLMASVLAGQQIVGKVVILSKDEYKKLFQQEEEDNG